jgi:hypothetical protein
MGGRSRSRCAPAGGAARSRRLGGAPPWRPPCPAGAPPEEKWPVSLGYRGLQGPPDGGWGQKNAPRDKMGGNLGAPGPGKFPPVFRPRIVQEAAQQRGRKSNGKHPLKRQFTLVAAVMQNSSSASTGALSGLKMGKQRKYLVLAPPAASTASGT